MSKKSIAIALIGMGLFAGGSARAATAAIDPATFTAVATYTDGPLVICGTSDQAGCGRSFGPASGSAQAILLPNDGPYAGDAAATVSGMPLPSIIASATAQAAELEPFTVPASPFSVTAGGGISYFFELVATPGSDYAGDVPVNMSGFSKSLGVTVDQGDFTETSVSLQIGTADGATNLFSLASDNNSSFGQTLTIIPGTEYEVSMGATAMAEVDADYTSDKTMIATAVIDPMFTIDPSCGCAGDFNLVLSPAIGNGATPAVPEPATWAMMLVGFGGLGARLRARRKARTARAL